jgi:hypothetical protein
MLIQDEDSSQCPSDINALSGSDGTKRTGDEATRSKDPLSRFGAIASPTRTSVSSPALAASADAYSTFRGAKSMPTTDSPGVAAASR